MKNTLLFAFLLAWAASGHAQYQKTITVGSLKFVEISERNPLEIPDFNAKAARVWGITLGTRVSDVQEALKNHPELKLEADRTSSTRYYLYGDDPATRKNENFLIAYLIWNDKTRGLNEIVLYSAACPFLHWDQSPLFNGTCLDPGSQVYTNFLGKPAKEEIEVDVPEIGLKSVRYYYPGKNLFLVEETNAGITKYALGLYLD